MAWKGQILKRYEDNSWKYRKIFKNTAWNANIQKQKIKWYRRRIIWWKGNFLEKKLEWKRW